MKWAVILAVGGLVFLLARQTRAADPADVRNWDYLDGYQPRTGAVL